MPISRRGPFFNRVDPTRPIDAGHNSFRSLFMEAMREDASYVSVRPHDKHPSLARITMKFLRERPIEILSPGLDELIAYLAALPSHQLRLNLDNLVDDKLTEFQPYNDLARERIAWFRSAPRKDYEVFIQVNAQERTVSISLKLVR